MWTVADCGWCRRTCDDLGPCCFWAACVSEVGTSLCGRGPIAPVTSFLQWLRADGEGSRGLEGSAGSAGLDQHGYCLCLSPVGDPVSDSRSRAPPKLHPNLHRLISAALHRSKLRPPVICGSESCSRAVFFGLSPVAGSSSRGPSGAVSFSYCCPKWN